MSQMEAGVDLTSVQQEALDALFEPFARSDAPGLVVGIARHGRLLYRRAFGLASVAQGVANTLGTRMRIGSTAKQFTCLAALLLAEYRLLDLDASVRRYLPELPALRGEPSLRQLMNHTGGYRCYLDLSFISDGLALKPQGSALATQLRQSDANFAPGEAQLYCNGGYHLLATAVERVAGQPLGEFLRRRVFEPLGMCQTEVVAGDYGVVPGLAALHLPHEGGYRLGASSHEDVVGDGAMVSTVDDMLRWLAHLREPLLVGSAHTWAQMMQAPILSDGRPTLYALGLMCTQYRGRAVLHHAGRVIGGASQALTLPEQGLDVVLMANTSASSPATLAKRVLDIVAIFDEAAPAAPRCADAPGFAGSRYAADDGLVIGFVDHDGALALTVFENGPLPLRRSDSGWLLAFEDSALGPLHILHATAETAPESLTVVEGGRPRSLRRLPPVPPPVVADFEGNYDAPDLLARAVLTQETDVALLHMCGESGEVTLTLRPLSETLLAWQSQDPLLPLQGVLRRTSSGFEIFTPRTRGVAFHRAGSAPGEETP